MLPFWIFNLEITFFRGSQWTGTYVMEFRDLIISSQLEVSKQPEEARFSFLKGGYVEDFELQGTYPSLLSPLLVVFKFLLSYFPKVMLKILSA